MKHKDKYIIFGIIALLFLVILFIFFYNSSPQEVKPRIEDKFPDVEEMHFSKLPITYSINLSFEKTRVEYFIQEAGRYERIQDIKKAFQIIEDSTDGVVYFEEVNEGENPDIMIKGLSPTIFEVVAATVNVSDSIWGFALRNNVSNIIANSSVYLLPIQTYSDEYSWVYGRCTNFPLIDVHEILHTFGFGHVFDSSNRVMFPLYPGLTCNVLEIDEKIINCLKKIYSNGQIEGDCSELNIYPYEIEEQKLFTDDFAWKEIPVNYSILNCSKNEIVRINYAISVFEDRFGRKFFNYRENYPTQVNFICKEDAKEELISANTHYWKGTTSVAINGEYMFVNGNISRVDINFVFYEKCANKPVELTQYEMLGVYSASGLQRTYGGDTYFPSSECNLLTTSSTTWDRIRELYS